MASATAFPYKSSHQTTPSEGVISGAIRRGISLVTSRVYEKPVLRQEIPIERWCYQYRNETTPMTLEDLKERGYALLFTLEGVARAAVEVVLVVVAKYFTKEATQEWRHNTILNAQLNSIRLTAWAIVNPNAAKKFIQTPGEDGRPVLGCAENAMQWGTAYDGELTIPLLSSNYNWR